MLPGIQGITAGLLVAGPPVNLTYIGGSEDGTGGTSWNAGTISIGSAALGAEVLILCGWTGVSNGALNTTTGLVLGGNNMALDINAASLNGGIVAGVAVGRLAIASSSASLVINNTAAQGRFYYEAWRMANNKGAPYHAPAINGGASGTRSVSTNYLNRGSVVAAFSANGASIGSLTFGGGSPTITEQTDAQFTNANNRKGTAFFLPNADGLAQSITCAVSTGYASAALGVVSYEPA